MTSQTTPSFSTKYIEIQGVEQTFKTKKGPFCALQNINLTVAKGEFVALSATRVAASPRCSI